MDVVDARIGQSSVESGKKKKKKPTNNLAKTFYDVLINKTLYVNKRSHYSIMEFSFC